jgi:hypothetical protein
MSDPVNPAPPAVGESETAEAAETLIRSRLRRATALLDQVTATTPPLLEDGPALREEARRLRPLVEAVAGRRYGRLPHVAYRGPLETRVTGPWSQYLTLGSGFTRFVRMTPWETSRPAIPTILAHELSHRFGFDESLTTLRGLEVSARLAEQGDPMHRVSSRLELARLLLGAAMGDAIRTGGHQAIDRFFQAHADVSSVARPSQQWIRVRKRKRPDWSLMVYAEMPCAALETALALGRSRSGDLPFPFFPLDSFQAVACAVYTAVDALTGRRRQAVPLGATLRLWQSADSADA